VRGLAAGATSLMQGREGGGNPDTQLYEGMMMAANRAPADAGTDALVHYLAAKQRAGGNWTGGGTTRAPMQDSDFSRTAMGIRILAVYSMPSRKAEMTERMERAAGWLAKEKPQSTEERVMQILGLTWAGSSLPLREKRLKELIALQRPDGGWAQTPWLASDAYATGQVLYMLHETGSDAKGDAAVRRGVDFLLRTQKDDGTWYVKSRAMKLQPYFQSGFPYDGDQWISEIASAWAAMALSTAPETTTLALRK
jgi:hypothetical protein